MRVVRSQEGSSESFVKHFDSLFEKYGGNKLVVVNLMNPGKVDEEKLSEPFQAIIT